MFLSLTQWIASLKRHWFAAGLSFVIVGFVTLFVILFGTREYRSVSRLLLRIGHENGTLDPVTTAAGERIAPIHTREDEVETAIGVMQSRTIMEDVVEQVGAERILRSVASRSSDGELLPSDGKTSGGILSKIKAQIGSIDPVSEREAAVRKLEKGFSISAPSKSSLISVEYTAKSPALAQELVEVWVATYLQHHSRVNRTQGTYDFFIQQDAKLKAQLETVHNQIRNAKSSGGFVTLEGHQQILESQLQNVRNDLLRASADLVEAVTRVESYEELLNHSVQKLTTEEVSGLASEARDEMRGVLFQLEILEKEYSAKYKEHHPKLLAIQDQLSNATKIVDAQEGERKELKQTANPTHQKIRENQVIDMALRDALANKLKKLTEQQAGLILEIQKLNGQEEILVSLSREAAVLENRNELHAVLLERARLNDVLQEQSITSINVVQPASFEARPVTPNKLMCAILGLFAAVVIAVSLPVLLDANLLFGSDFREQNQPESNVRGREVFEVTSTDRRKGSSLAEPTNQVTAVVTEPVVNTGASPIPDAACNGNSLLGNPSLSQPPTLPR